MAAAAEFPRRDRRFDAPSAWGQRSGGDVLIQRLNRYDLAARLAAVTPPWTTHFLVGFGVSSITAGVRVLIDATIRGVVPFVLVFPAVLISTTLAGWQAGAWTLAITEFLVWFVVVPPAWSFQVKSPADLVSLLLVTLSAALVIVMTEALRRSARRVEEERERQVLLNNELNHRVKNTLASVQSMAVQTFGPEEASRMALDVFESRLVALARAHDVLTRRSWLAAELREIVADVLEPFSTTHQIEGDGPEVWLTAAQALVVSIALHELATNALKYGALSVPEGRIRIAWKTERRQWRLTWRESNGPAVAPPTREGFGARMLQRGLARELDGDVILNFFPTGVVCEIRGPLTDQDAHRREPQKA